MSGSFILPKTVHSGNQARGIAVENGPDEAGPRAGGTSMTEYEPKADSSSVPCPWDGCEHTATSVKGMKIHHAKAHGESIAGVVVSCSWCGDSIKRKPCEAERDDYHFCGGDKECFAKWRSECRSGENHSFWNGGKVTVECSWCGDSIKRKPHEAERYTKYFCGDKNCYGEWRSENFIAGDNPSWNGGKVTVECSWCGSGIERTPSEAGRYEDFFCNRESCKAQWRSENWSGENHPNWTGGAFPYGSGFTETKKENVRERQDRCCAGCGTHESELPRKLDVHHIQKARSFDDDEARNDDSILVAVCLPCHRQWEQMTPLRPQTPYLD